MGAFLGLCFGSERIASGEQQHSLLLHDDPSDSPGVHVLHTQRDCSNTGLDYAQIEDVPSGEKSAQPSSSSEQNKRHVPSHDECALDYPHDAIIEPSNARVSHRNSNPTAFQVPEEEEDVSDLYEGGDESDRESDVSELEQEADQEQDQSAPGLIPATTRTDLNQMLELTVETAGHEGVNGTYRWFPLHKSYVLFHDAGQFQIKPTKRNWVLEEITQDGHIKLYAAPRNAGDLSTVVMQGWFSCGGVEPVPKLCDAKFNEVAVDSRAEPDWGEDAVFAGFDMNTDPIFLDDGMSEDGDASDISGMSS